MSAAAADHARQPAVLREGSKQMLFASLIQNWKPIALAILTVAILVYRAVLVHQRDSARAQVAALTDAAAVLRAANASMAAAVTQQNQAVAALQAKMKLAQGAAAARETDTATHAAHANPALPIAGLAAASAPADTLRAYAATVVVLKATVRELDSLIAGCAEPTGAAGGAPADGIVTDSVRVSMSSPGSK